MARRAAAPHSTSSPLASLCVGINSELEFPRPLAASAERPGVAVDRPILRSASSLTPCPLRDPIELMFTVCIASSVILRPTVEERVLLSRVVLDVSRQRSPRRAICLQRQLYAAASAVCSSLNLMLARDAHASASHHGRDRHAPRHPTRPHDSPGSGLWRSAPFNRTHIPSLKAPYRQNMSSHRILAFEMIWCRLFCTRVRQPSRAHGAADRERRPHRYPRSLFQPDLRSTCVRCTGSSLVFVIVSTRIQPMDPAMDLARSRRVSAFSHSRILTILRAS